MINVKNIHSLSDFQRNTKAHVARLKKSGEPEILTVNGQAQLAVMSASALQRLFDELEMLENLNAIHKGMLEAHEGKGIPADELIRRLRNGTKRRKSA